MSATRPPIPNYAEGRWQIDPANSAVTFTVRHMLINTMHGRFNEFAGEIVTSARPLESQSSRPYGPRRSTPTTQSATST
jgi:polyisoprenoid-binding protein YceI